jgi:DNA gyrase/topoisomerase IV subunit A
MTAMDDNGPGKQIDDRQDALGAKIRELDEALVRLEEQVKLIREEVRLIRQEYPAKRRDMNI